MAQTQLLQLPKTQFSGLEYSNILEDVYNMVRETPEYNENWDDFLSGDAGVMLTEIFSWITDQLATRVDWVVNENFIGTATQRSSIINLLKLIGYKFALPASAEVPVTITTDADIGLYAITPEYLPAEGVFYPKTLLAKDKKGQTKYFEAINYDSVTNEYNYHLAVEIDTTATTSHAVDFYEGQTKIENFSSTTNSGQVFPLSENPVVRYSIKVFLVTYDESTEITTESQLLEVDSFLALEAQQETNSDGSTNAIPYVVNVLEDDAVEITFGSSSLLADQNRRLSEGSDIRVFYRVGGGADGEISRGAINFTEDLTGNDNTSSTNYTNNTEGVGAEDSETIEHAAYVGPLQIKTAGKTVTEEDYDIILSSFINVLLSKAYGHNNIPDNFYEKYGYYISPLEVLNFVLMKKSGWEEVPTSKYKYSNWGTFNLENYFNEVIKFSDGDFGVSVKVNSGQDLVLGEIYDYDNQGGRIFNNYTVIQTPQEWKDNIFIEDPDDDDSYIANVNAKASLTHTEYDRDLHQTLEDIPDHFVANDGDTDPFFYGDDNDSGLPTEEINEDIQAYFISKKDTSVGVYIGTNHLTSANQLRLNVDNHGDVDIDLSLGGINSGLVPLDGVNGIIDVINTKLEDAYNNVYSYHDFGIKVPDTTAVVENLEDLDEDIWFLRVSDIDFDINLGHSQTYDDLLGYMNDGFANFGVSGYQNFADSAPWTVVDTTAYDVNVSIDDATPINITLDPVSGTSLTAENLIGLLNIEFRSEEIPAVASLDGTAVRVSSNETGTTSKVSLTAGTNQDLLAVTGAMISSIDGTGIAGCNLVATFVQSQTNIACSDVRISRTNVTGTVLLADSGTTVDILAAYGALPISTEPVEYGDYTDVATIHDYGSFEQYIKLTSPNSGSAAGVAIKKPLAEDSRDATSAAFGLDFEGDGVDEYMNYGQRRLTIIFRDTSEDDFGDFIYEHGSVNLNVEDPANVYLNYLISKSDSIRLGNYYTENYGEEEPEYKLPANRIYNTIYKLDEDNIDDPLAEKIDYDVSDFIVKFTKSDINDNSIYVIDETVDLVQTKHPTIDSIVLNPFPDTTGKYVKLSINGNAFKSIDVDDVVDGTGLAAILNSSFYYEANEFDNQDITFAVWDETTDVLTLETDDATQNGKITIYDDEGDLLIGATIFDTAEGENTDVLPLGDYYLTHVVDDDAATAEELFGYFTMNIIPNSPNSIPDLNFYCHLVNDRRHIFLDENVYRVHTDEDDLIESLYPYKIAGVDNSFKRPIFNTFDVIAEVFITTSASSDQVKESVEVALRDFYSLENTTLAESANKSEFIGIVLGVTGVRYINISFFGHDMQDIETDENLEIETGFDEILVLSDDTFNESGVQTHGLAFNYTTL